LTQYPQPTYCNTLLNFTVDGVTPANLFFTWTVTSAPATSGAQPTSPNTQQTSFEVDATGPYTLTVKVCDGCGQCTSAPVSFTVTPHNIQSVASASSTNVTFVDNHFPRIEVDGRNSNLDGENITLFTYTWLFTAAPPNSTYAPVTMTVIQVTNSSSTVTTPMGNYTENVTTVTTNTLTSSIYQYTELKPASSHNTVYFPGCFHPGMSSCYHCCLMSSCLAVVAWMSALRSCDVPLGYACVHCSHVCQRVLTYGSVCLCVGL